MYLVYLPDVGRPSEPLIQKYVGRGSSCIADDEEEDQSRNPRRRRADDVIAGTEDLEVRHDRRVCQRSVELAPRVPRFNEVFCVVGVPAEVREVAARKIHDAGGFKAYEKRHANALVAIFVPKLRLPPEMIRHVVFYWAHVGFY